MKSEEEYVDMDDRIKHQIAKMSMKNNYWGFLFSRVRRISDESLPAIAGVSYDNAGRLLLFYNPILYKGTKDDVFEKILEHEGMHIINKHISRFLRMFPFAISDKEKNKLGRIWNYAIDCCVNEQIGIDDVVEVNGKPYPLCKPKKFNLPSGKIAEYYYHELLKQSKDNEKDDTSNGEGESGDGEPQLLDDHSKWCNGEGDKETSGKEISVIARKIENNTNKLIKDSLKNFNKKRGSLSGALEELLKEALEPPKLPYYQIIKKLIRGSRLSKFKRTPTRINRKRVYTFLLNGNNSIPKISPFPGRTRDYSFDIGILLDTSGSMSKEEIMEGLSSIKNMFENDRHCRITVIENDTSVKKEYEIKRISDIQFNICGRGGTVLQPGLKRMSEIKPDVVLIFTDAEIDDITRISKKELPKKMIWVIPENADDDCIKNTGYVVRVD